jgi:glycerol kinase
MSSYLVFNLLQQKNCYADPVSASRTLLWNINQKDWDEELLALFGISRELLPRCVPTRHTFGHLTIGGHNVPLKIMTGDQSAAMYAYGNVQYETGYVNVGTGAFISRPSGHSMVYARRLLTSVIYSEDSESQYVLEGTVNGGGSAIEWMQNNYPVEDLWSKLPGWLNTESNPPLFLNGISGLAAPYWIADFETELVHGGDIAANYVAVVESIAFLLNANVQEMLKFSSPPQQLQITGGLARLDGLCQRLADLCRLPVYRPKECEATARGTAYLAAGRPAHWPENRHGDWFNPSRNTTVLDRRFLLWEQAMLQRMRKEAA